MGLPLGGQASSARLARTSISGVTTGPSRDKRKLRRFGAGVHVCARVCMFRGCEKPAVAIWQAGDLDERNYLT